MKAMKFIRFLCMLLVVLCGSTFILFLRSAGAEQCIPEQIQKIDDIMHMVARIYFIDRNDLKKLTGSLDVWEINHREGYILAAIRPYQYMRLLEKGYRIEVDDEMTISANQVLEYPPAQISGIAGYSCYRTVEEINSTLHGLSSKFPSLASVRDIGDSWEKIKSDGDKGYDLFVVTLTNKNVSGPKPRFFLMGAIHARELATSETALRFAEHLLSNYDRDPDITWLLDFYEVHILPMANPDGRKLSESGIWWRKNTDNNDGCNNSNYWGTDLNRNYGFKWDCCAGSSDNPCDDTYHGPAAASEPEVKAVQDYLKKIFPDQRGPGDTDAAPDDATGVLVSLHSYGEQVLWPWGWTFDEAPNADQLQTLGRKIAYFNGYRAITTLEYYLTEGCLDDWAYGELGIAAYTVEMGTAFYQDCNTYESIVHPKNLDSLLYAFKAARRPYQNPAGPDTIDITLSSVTAFKGAAVTLRATADDTNYSSLTGIEPVQNILSARYTVDSPSWVEGAIAYPLEATDGAFDNTVEDMFASIDTTGWTVGRHTIFVESQDAAGNWGVPSAIFLYIEKQSAIEEKVKVVPKTVSFGSIKRDVTTEQKSFSVMNIGSKDLEITSLEVIGPNQSDFSLDHSCADQLRPGDSCSVTVTVHPSEFGKRKADIIISFNGTTKKLTKKVHLTANARPPKLSIKPNTLSFGNVPVAQSLTKAIYLTNRGISDLDVQSVSIEADVEVNYSYVNTCKEVIPEGNSCAIDITFAPHSKGTKSAILKIFTNEPRRQMRSVRLVGKGK